MQTVRNSNKALLFERCEAKVAPAMLYQRLPLCQMKRPPQAAFKRLARNSRPPHPQPNAPLAGQVAERGPDQGTQQQQSND